MLVVFCSDPLHPREVDEVSAAERAAAEHAGFQHALVSYEALVYEGDASRAVRRVPEQASETLAVYRGWMLRPHHYAQLYSALAERGVRLVNDPAAYQHSHYLPEWYSAVAGHTPRSVWTPTGPEVDPDRVMELLRPFGDAPVIVKDYVKSRKHEWAEACYIPSASDRSAVERIVRRFMELQGEDLAEGLVFREYVELQPIGEHPKSGMPLTEEYRLFFLDGEPIMTAEYWESGAYGGTQPEQEPFLALAKGVHSSFFTMDVARRATGDWIVVELGDAQVAGMPERGDPEQFYRAMAAHWPGL
jgi:hypothetical protein